MSQHISFNVAKNIAQMSKKKTRRELEKEMPIVDWELSQDPEVVCSLTFQKVEICILQTNIGRRDLEKEMPIVDWGQSQGPDIMCSPNFKMTQNKL